MSDTQHAGGRGRLGGLLRAAVTAVVGFAVWWVMCLDAPASVFHPGMDMAGMPAQALREVVPGLGPIATAFMLVEALALLVPRWRRLRRDGVTGRARLRRTALMLAFGVLAFQILGVFLFLRRVELFEPESFAVLAAAMSASVIAFVALGAVLDRFGLGSGFAVLFVCSALGQPWELHMFLKLSDPLGALLPFAMVLASAILLELTARWPNASAFLWPVPVSGVLVVGWSRLWFDRVDGSGLADVPSTSNVLVTTAGLMVAALVLAQLVARLPPQLQQQEEWRVRWRAVVGLSVGIVGALTLLEYGLPVWVDATSVSGAVRGTFRPVFYALVAALVLDWSAELRARLHLGEVVDVWEEPRGWAVVVALEALDKAGIPAVARGARFHALHQIFAPHFATRIAVRPEDAARADAVLLAALGAEGDRQPALRPVEF